MNLSEIDSNLKIETSVNEPDIVWLNARSEPFSIHGVFFDEESGCFLRIPRSLSKRVSNGVHIAGGFTAGGRVRFKTNSPFIAIRAVMHNVLPISCMTRAGQSGFDLYRVENGREIFISTFAPPVDMTDGYSSSAKVSGELCGYTINFPLYDGVDELYIALKKDAVLLPAEPYRDQLPVVYYGSSITEGYGASRPGNSYEGFISRRFNVDYINLGFSGSCRGEDDMADYIASLPMSALVIDFDHNAPNPEFLEGTHLHFYRRIRSMLPDTPFVFVSAPDIIFKPAVFSKRREIVRQTFMTSLEEGDKNTRLVDGAALLVGEDWDSCSVDNTHPNDFGYHRMSKHIGDALAEFIR